MIVLALATAAWLLSAALPALLPFIIGLLFAYVLLPLVNALAGFMPCPVAILLVYATGIAVVASSTTYLVPLVVDQVQQLIAITPSFN
jgi:predicted PurR-regulated permease PerM